MEAKAVKASSLLALDGAPWNVEYVLELKRRLEEKGVEESYNAFAEEKAAMMLDALERVRKARAMRDQAAELVANAREEEKAAETLANMGTASIRRRLGP